MKPHDLVASFAAAVRRGEPMAAPSTAWRMDGVGNAPTIGLHVYGGDIFELPRRMWHPQTFEEHRLDCTLYENFARIASEAPAP